ncbi:MAG: MFS transporter [Candidatus Hodarchaeales archaeon]|jgi:2,4-dienoyl-CoA reductase-like NADH-dependent reductase (Old Yellow Enzyme family)
MNWNVRLAYIQTIAQAIGFGIVQTAFAVYVTSGLGQSNAVLGNLFTVSGLASTIFVFPSGWAADKWRRDTLIRISVFFGILSQITLLYGIFLPISSKNTVMSFLFIAQAFGGLGWGLSGPAAQALLADSIEPGNRSKVFANMHFVNLIAAAIGPFLAAGLSILLGDRWEVSLLRPIITVGIIAAATSYLAVLFVSDEKALVSIQDKKIVPKQAESSQEEEGDSLTETYKIWKYSFHKPQYEWSIPAIIVISGIIIGFGAGATVAFFPVFFKEEYSILPVFTYIIFGITNVVTGFAGLLAQRMIKFFGRIVSMFIVQGLAIICLLGLVFNLMFYQNSIIPFELSVVFLVVFYISRNALMNASGPISRSIVMDIVPPSSRAKWNSLETLAWGMFWSVSASVGGVIVDSYGFIFVFLFTATLYTFATLLLLTIRNKVPKESVLTHKYQLGKLKTRNRVVLPSISVTDDLKLADVSGQLTSAGISYYENSAKGGVGLVYLEPAYISNSGRKHSYQVGIHEDYVVSRLQEVVKKIHANDALVGIRLNHAGGGAPRFLTGEKPLAPTMTPIIDNETPHALTKEEISKLKAEYVHAAIRASRIGVDIIEISACMQPIIHSNLIGQFLSPDINTRIDEYGGTFDNRLRFPLDIIRSIEDQISPEIMLSFHLTMPFPGLSEDELLVIISAFNNAGIDLLSIGYPEKAEHDESIDYFIQQVKSTVQSLPLILHSDFDIQSAESTLRKGQVDFIGFEKLLQEDQSFPQALR